MSTFPLHSIETAPDAAKPLLQKAVKDYGMLPGLYQVMASSPELLESYFKLHELFERSALSVAERNVVWLAINVEHSCHYCVPAHTAIAIMQGVDDTTISALREERPLADPRLEALRKFTLILVRERGNAPQKDVDDFLAAGFEHRAILDILVGLAQKVLSNYTNHLAETPIDKPFLPHAWEKAEVTTA
ncbi:carboxymuconolactone decarboxylase family protein [Epibacterium ulvae]|uniref:Alkylhydroperoxidase AhpD family core domain-containing protein n=1 Tax=Epibacterium ulvae TaxID=1156985 RepID=A0A1G5R000_9RHOB|nr:carboxymuconolactone decarboxylase family protein [Epibacterium ulvae]SCZ67425.1 alkylhydroperoxidase AhpD family core domain-containing protein [Epibacterium ulvae]